MIGVELAPSLSGVICKGDAAAGALLSLDGVYRYALWRTWGAATREAVLFVMLNPSTADDRDDDNTIRRCRYYTASWGHDGFAVVNLYAYRATEPRDLRRALIDPIGAANAVVMEAYARAVPLIVCAWGTPAASRGERIARDLSAWSQRPLHILALTKDGAPHHPLRLPNGLRAAPWTAMNLLETGETR